MKNIKKKEVEQMPKNAVRYVKLTYKGYKCKYVLYEGEGKDYGIEEDFGIKKGQFYGILNIEYPENSTFKNLCSRNEEFWEILDYANADLGSLSDVSQDYGTLFGYDFTAGNAGEGYFDDDIKEIVEQLIKCEEIAKESFSIKKSKYGILMF